MLKRVLDLCSIIRVQSWDIRAPVPMAVSEMLGVALPENGTVVAARAKVIGVGPADWLVITPDPEVTPWLQRLEAAFGGGPCRATDLTQAFARIEVHGPHTRELLAKGCSLDLHSSLFPPGRCARTRFAGMPVIVECTASSTFECIVTLSYAEYLLKWLTDAALEFTEPTA
jgi:sarcosine oxidase subunit gamma